MQRKEQLKVHRRAVVPSRPVKEKARVLPSRLARRPSRGVIPALSGALLESITEDYRGGLLSYPMYSRSKELLMRQVRRVYGHNAAQRFAREMEVRRAGGVQAKIVVGAAGDRYEREADRVARAVLAFLSSRGGKPALGLAGKDRTLRRAPQGGGRISAEGGMVDRRMELAIRAARGGGRLLPGTLRTEMERAFGADFRGVRIHTGPTPDRLNRYLGSAAFTAGRDIFFLKGYFRPGARQGLEVLAHELAHVVQQGYG